MIKRMKWPSLTGKPVGISHVFEFLYSIFTGITSLDIKIKVNLLSGHRFKVAHKVTDIHSFSGRLHFGVQLFRTIPAFGLVSKRANKLLMFDDF